MSAPAAGEPVETGPAAAGDGAATPADGEGGEDGEDEEEALIRNLGRTLAQDPGWSPLAAASLMVFVLIYAPCFVTVAVIHREIGPRWAAFALTVNTLYAYLLCLVLYQGGRALGLG